VAYRAGRGAILLVILRAVFWASFGLLFYVYAGYPLVLALLARYAKKAPGPIGSLEVPVTLLISAYNEKEVICQKVENSLALDYPSDLLEIMVISDASDDGTDELVQRYGPKGTRLLRQEPRQGKTAGLNFGVSQATGQILVFSDANALYQPDAIRNLVRHFCNPNVGYVVGNARYYEQGTESSSAQSEGVYWKLETFLKKRESAFASVVGGDGAIYAIRRELYSPLLPTDINDFLNPLQIIARGYSGVFEPRAICYEEAAKSFDQEYRRKVRIVSRSLNAMRRVPAVLNPFENSRHWFLLISHKVLRWFAPFFMIALFLCSLILWRGLIYGIATLLQAVFYGTALIVWMRQSKHKAGRLVSLAFYFCLVNTASLVGCIKCLRGDLSVKWSPPREKVSSRDQAQVASKN